MRDVETKPSLQSKLSDSMGFIEHRLLQVIFGFSLSSFVAIWAFYTLN